MSSTKGRRFFRISQLKSESSMLGARAPKAAASELSSGRNSAPDHGLVWIRIPGSQPHDGMHIGGTGCLVLGGFGGKGEGISSRLDA